MLADALVRVKRKDGKVVDSLLWTINDTCKALNLGRSAVYELLRQGRIESIHIGRRRLVPREAVERFVSSERAAQAEEHPE